MNQYSRRSLVVSAGALLTALSCSNANAADAALQQSASVVRPLHIQINGIPALSTPPTTSYLLRGLLGNCESVAHEAVDRKFTGCIAAVPGLRHACARLVPPPLSGHASGRDG
jgi:hypothetical protein